MRSMLTNPECCRGDAEFVLRHLLHLHLLGSYLLNTFSEREIINDLISVQTMMRSTLGNVVGVNSHIMSVEFMYQWTRITELLRQ